MALLVLGAGLFLRRGRPPAQAEGARITRGSNHEDHREANVVAQPRGRAPSVPRLVPAVPAVEIGSGDPWEGVGSVGEDDRRALTELDRQARARAVAELALSASEAEQISEIHHRSDARLGELEGQVATQRARDPLAPVPIRPLRERAAVELAELAAVLGPQRARQLRESERRHYRNLFRGSFPQPVVAVDNAHRRRSMWLRWDPTAVVHVPEGASP